MAQQHDIETKEDPVDSATRLMKEARETEQKGDIEKAESLESDAATLAESLGYSDNTTNPFSEEIEPMLHRQYEKGVQGKEILKIVQAKEAAKDNYETAYMNSLALRTDFANKPGYVREKQPDELAYHAVKKAFGEFRPNDREAMEQNTNNGKGAEVNLPGGGKAHIDNQAQLYDKVVQFNKERGRFYDEPYIKETSPEDHQRLIKTNEDMEKTRQEFLAQYTNRKEGYKDIRTLEDHVKSVYEEMKKLKSHNLDKLKKPLDKADVGKSEEQAIKIDTGSKDKLIAEQLGLTEEEMANVRARAAAAASHNVAGKQDRETSQKEDNTEGLRPRSDSEKGSVTNTTSDEKTIEAKKVSDRPAKSIPEELNAKYVIDGDNQKGKYYFKDKPEVEAFRDKGTKLITKSSATSVAKSMVTLAETKQWETIKLSGSEKFRREVWMEAKLRGMEVEGYKPSEQDIQNIENRLNKIENAAPNTGKEAVTTTTKVATTQVVKEEVLTEGKATVVKPPTQPELTEADKRVINKRQELWNKEKAAGQQPKEALTSSADQKVVEVRDRLDREAKEQQRYIKDELRDAYMKLSKDDAIKKYPALVPLYNLEKAANHFVNHDRNKGKFDEKGKERFVSAVREKALDTLDRGEKLPTVQERIVETKTVEKELETSR